MSRATHLVLGAIVTTVMIAGTALLSSWPTYRTLPEGVGVVTLSFSHGGARNCRERTEAELAKLPPTLRQTEVCERKRQPVYVEMDIDNEPVYRASLPPSGIARDGPSRVYERFVLPAGDYEIAVRLRDTSRTEGFDDVAVYRLSLSAGQSFVIDFRRDTGGFIFH